MANKINYTRSRLRGTESQLAAAKEHGVPTTHAQFNCKGKWSAAKSLCKTYGCRSAKSIGTDFLLYQNILKYQASTDKIEAQKAKFEKYDDPKEVIKEEPKPKKVAKEAKKEASKPKKVIKKEDKPKKKQEKLSKKIFKK